MTTHLLAAIIDHSFSILFGLLVSLLGFRVLGPKPGANQKYDVFYGQWGKHLKWLGPLMVVFGVIQITIAVLAK